MTRNHPFRAYQPRRAALLLWFFNMLLCMTHRCACVPAPRACRHVLGAGPGHQIGLRGKKHRDQLRSPKIHQSKPDLVAKRGKNFSGNRSSRSAVIWSSWRDRRSR